MMNQHSSQQGSTLPTRSVAADAARGREMPLLFQLADANRLIAAPTGAKSPATPTVEIPAGPGPLPMSPLPTAIPSSGTPLATSAPSTWSQVPAGLFETSSGFSTAGLAAGSTSNTKDSLTEAPSAAPAATEEPAKPAAAKLPATEPATDASPKGLPSAIASAVKVATETDEQGPAESPSAVPASEKTTEALKTDPVATVTNIAAAMTPTVTNIAAAMTPVDSPKEASTSASASSTKSTPAPSTEASTTDKPSPGSLRRQRSEARQQKVASKNNDWLSSHGKVIAIGFVIALIGTIYLARRNQPAPESAPNAEPLGLAIEVPDDHVGPHDHKTTDEANTAPRLVEAPALPHDAAPSPATTAPAATDPGTATADLHAPVVPSATGPGGAPLFPWQNDTRTATRPEPAGSVTPVTSTTPLSTPDANSPPNGPTLDAPTYPETNLRDAPLLPPAPATAPAPSPAGSQGSGHAPSRSYPASFTSAPGGTRYERTGSGLY